MDVLADILTVTRLSGHVGCYARCDPPWGIRFEPAPKVWFHLIAAGGGVFIPKRGESIVLGPRDLVLLPHGDGHVLADSRTSPTRTLEQWAARPSKETGRTELMCGSYSVAFAEIHPVLRLLPSVIHIPGAMVRKTLGMQATLDMLVGELGDRDVGSERVVSRLLEVMFVLVLRRWLDENAATGWLGALRDEPIGKALVALHTEPGRAWSVGGLARRVGLSRPVFARRFSAKVGDTPLGYLRKLRLDLASVMLHDTDESVASIANTVGYTSEFAFNRAFQRARGTPPGRYRRETRGAAPRSS